MCTELGNDEYMTAYIEDAGKTSLCSVDSGAGCSDRELKYMETQKAAGPEKVAAQLARLESMAGKSMKPDLQDWLNKRTKILQQLNSAAQQKGGEL